MRKTLAKSTPIQAGAWVGIAPRCRNSVLQGYGFTDGQIKRLKAGEFVAVDKAGTTWLVWDVRGRDVHIKVPTKLLRVFSETNEKPDEPRDWEAESLRLFAHEPIEPEQLGEWVSSVPGLPRRGRGPGI